LEEQVLQPIVNPKEMDLTLDEAVARLKNVRDYRWLFQVAFQTDVGIGGLSEALASYLRTILLDNAPVDRYMNGHRNALSAQAAKGLAVFREKGECATCHMWPAFTDDRFDNTGVGWGNGRLSDPGRFAVSGRVEDHGAFKTPTLREIGRTAPYTHDGSLATLSDVIEYFDRGGNPNPYLDRSLRPLHLSDDEKKALAAFLLEGLDGDVRDGQLR
jgi:cytochrome c peroxidase